MSSPRILFAGLFHETHTFLPERTRWEDFEITLGDAVLAKLGDESPTAGFLEAAKTYGWTVVPTIDARAVPSGTVTDAMFERYWQEFETRARPALAAGVAGIYVVLHGAMVTETIEDVEGEFLRRLRALPGAATVPLFGPFDLHANVSPAMCRHANGLVGYRKNPHTDGKATAVKAADLLARCLRTGVVPRMHWCRVPLIWAPPGTGTADDPMRTLTALAERCEESQPATWAFNIAPGFAFADTTYAGLTLSCVSTAGEGPARAQLTEMAQTAWELREKGEVRYPAVETLLARLKPDPRGPTLLVEPADNIGAGAPGDGTGILRAFVTQGTVRALVAINDAAAAARATAATPGETLTLALGGRGWAGDAGPLELEVTLVAKSDGAFQLEDAQSHLASMSGTRYEMGPCAVVKHRGVTILITSRKTPPFDLGQYRSQGIEPKDFAFIGVKAAVAHRRAYDPIAAASYFVDTPGPCSSNLHTFPYRRVQAPVFPLHAAAGPDFLFA